MARFKSGFQKIKIPKQHIYTKQSNRATMSYGKKFNQAQRKQADNAMSPSHIKKGGV